MNQVGILTLIFLAMTFVVALMQLVVSIINMTKKEIAPMLFAGKGYFFDQQQDKTIFGYLVA